MTVKDKKGKVTETSFKSASMWKKQADGAWKMVVDTWSHPALPAGKWEEPDSSLNSSAS